MNAYLKCVSCLAEYPLDKDIFTCKKHSPYYGYLIVMYDNQILYANEKNLWKKYQDFFPTQKFVVTFDEQVTPLIKLNGLGQAYGLSNLYLKDESKNPTGSFKDRENLIAINKAVEWGITEIFVVSSGNAAVSTAAYTQKAGIENTSYVSKNLSVGKRMLIGMYGSQIVEQDGTYEQMYRRAIDQKYPGWNCTPGFNPLKEEGVKMIGFEIWEQINVPDVIIVPSGNGTLLFGIYKAFKELQHIRIVKSLPQMIGVQIKGAAPLKLAFEQGQEYLNAQDIPNSFAEGILAEESYSSPKVMLALKDTKGKIVEVTDEEMAESLLDLTKMESIIPEPTSLAVFAAVKKLSLDPAKKIVLVLSAGGVKNLKEILEILILTKKK